MLHLDLFSGIGGFAYAIDQVYENTEHIFCEIDPFCRAVLKKHWPEAEIYGDIRTLTTNTECGGYFHGEFEKLTTEPNEQAQRKFIANFPTPFILTGGFPCQPFSQAGRRKGTDDNRHLWPEMLRVIREFRPEWVIAENVAGLLTIQQGMVFGQVLSDLESQNYEIQPFVIPAVAVNAPHRRDRIWIIAHAIRDNDRKEEQRKFFEAAREQDKDRTSKCPTRQFGGADKIWENERLEKNGLLEKNDSHSEREGRRQRNIPETGQIARQDSDAPNPRRVGQEEQKQQTAGDEQYSWSRNWIEIASSLCDVAYGLPIGLVRPDGERDRNYPWWRTQALKAGGNAIVPQVAIEILKGIKSLTP